MRRFRSNSCNLAFRKYPIMKYFFLCCLGIIGTSLASAQNAPYFQQETHYRIEVQLDDRSHLLHGMLELRYVNHAPDTLPYIWFHLWPNAYRDQTSAFARQQLRLNGTEYYFAKDNQLGYMDSLEFTVDGQPARLEYAAESPDMARLWLPQPLQPGDSIYIRTPFRVKIPDSFSRLGHIDQSYQITQWYPKPAVYDPSGWHQMPYLDQGEFYSEFGSFEVAITLPQNYVVGASGTLETPAELDFLHRRAVETTAYLESLPVRPSEGYAYEDFPPSSDQWKTIRYRADRVHDFAWFADKRFKVQQSSVHTPAGREVLTWTMFTSTEEQLWRKAIQYVNRSVAFYSELVGDYPYPQATAVQSALSAGGGMEYPMITVIDLAGTDRSLDEVITHEIGHNWFYGLLASNERDHPWMDEGINSFYEQRYMRRYYPPAHQLIVPDLLVDPADFDLSELVYLMQARRRMDQAPDTPSDAFSSATNYWMGAYDKPAKAFWWLYYYWGAEKFDGAMQQYFRKWQFRHPQPADLRHSLEQYSGEDLSWLFDGLLQSNQQLDYAIKELSRDETGWKVRLENRGAIAAPFPLAAWANDSLVDQRWITGFNGEQTIVLPIAELERVEVDPHHQTLDINRKNNLMRSSGSLKKASTFRMPLLAKVENERYTSLYWLPILGWNFYDGFQAGLLLHNRSLPEKQFEFDLLPFYGARSRELTGLGNLNYWIYPEKGAIESICLGLNFRSFHFERQDQGVYDLRYQRRQPSLVLGLRRPPASLYTHQLGYRLILLTTDVPQIGREEGFMGLDQQQTTIHELRYTGIHKGHLHPFQLHLALEQQAYTDVFNRREHYLKWSLDWSAKLAYGPGRNWYARLFVGGFLDNSRRRAGAVAPGAFSLIDQAATDYRFDDFYFGRSERRGFLANQLSQRDGGFKAPVSPAFNLGKSNNFIAALNLKADLPVAKGFPLRPYFDIGYFDNAMPTGAEDTFKDQLLWSGGLALEIFDGRLGFYFPVVNSRNIQDRLLELGHYGRRISFRFELYGEKARELWERSLP